MCAARFADAERDCTTSLALDGKQTKAWFRRAIARRGLGQYTHAREGTFNVLVGGRHGRLTGRFVLFGVLLSDFATVLRLDPKMAASVKAELAKLDTEEKAAAVHKGKNGKPRVRRLSPLSSLENVPDQNRH